VLQKHPEVDVFILDDGFQHRSVSRNLDVVLISGRNPFGYGHVLPRGMLREPMRGLRRASAIVITHYDGRDEARMREITEKLEQAGCAAPVYRAKHLVAGFRNSATASSAPVDTGPTGIQSSNVFAFCGIASPSVFFDQLKQLSAKLVDNASFPDHHHYSAADLAGLRERAKASGAQLIVTTEKDWAKVSMLEGAIGTDLPIWRMDIAIDFVEQDGDRFLEQVHNTIPKISA
jgi:tetraacyldisaccharide 4'-kinase